MKVLLCLKRLATRYTLRLHLFAGLLLASTSILLPNDAHATLVGPMHIPSLANKSALIVKGRVVAIEKSAVDPKGLTGRVQIEEVLKGEWNEKDIVLAYPQNAVMGAPIDTLKKGEYAIFFLKPGVPGIVPVDIYHIKVPVVEGPRLRPNKTADVLERIREELILTAEMQPPHAQQEQQNNVPQAIENTIDFALSGLPVNAFAAKQLGDFAVEERTTTLLKKLADSPDQLLRGSAIEALLKINQANALTLARDYLNTVQASNKSPINVKLQRSAVIRAIKRFKSVDSIEILVELLSFSDPHVRNSAIVSLRQTGRLLKRTGYPLKKLEDAKTIPYLVKALDDLDPEVRIQAIWSLSEMASRPQWYPKFVHEPTNSVAQDEKKIIEQWKHWWENEARKVFEDANVAAN